METKKRKVLVVAYSFPPLGISAAQRPSKFTKYLANFGWRPYVLTARGKGEPIDYSTTEEIPKNVEIAEVFSFAPINMIEVVKQKFRRKGFRKLAYYLLRVIIKIYSIIYYRLVVPDWYAGWIPVAVIRGKQIIDREDIDLICAHSQPPSSFIVGYLLKTLSKKPLVTDYDDPWTTYNYHKQEKNLKYKIERYIENKILISANAVVCNKPHIVKDILNTFPQVNRDKCHLITRGFDPEDYLDINREKRNDKLTITYTGRLSERFCYSPESFIKALGQLIDEKRVAAEHIHVIFAGTISAFYRGHLKKLVSEMNLEHIIELKEFVPHNEVIKLQVMSDLLLLIMESYEGEQRSLEHSGMLPAKIFEYINARTPILAIVPPGVEAELIRKTNTGFIVKPNDVLSLKKLFISIYDSWKVNNIKIEPNWEEINKYNCISLTKDLTSIFDDIVSTEGFIDHGG